MAYTWPICIAIKTLGKILGEVLANFRSNLAVGHIVRRFDIGNAPTESIFFKMCFQLCFGLTRTEYQNVFRIMNARQCSFRNRRRVVS